MVANLGVSSRERWTRRYSAAYRGYVRGGAGSACEEGGGWARRHNCWQGITGKAATDLAKALVASNYFASWKMMATVCRCPVRTTLTMRVLQHIPLTSCRMHPREPIR